MDEIFSLIDQERKRQEETLALIPSENYASGAVRKAVGSVMMNKYSEGQVGKRYYQGNAIVDEIEGLCKSRALKVFGLDKEEWGVNVQALSGSPANLAVYAALLEPQDKILSMHLMHGGHLSHGWRIGEKKVNFVSKVWQVDFYQVDKRTQLIDYDELDKKAKEYKPKMLISGGTAYPREIDHKRMGEIAKKVGAYYLADIAHEAGLVVGGVNKSPFNDADVVTMTTHKTLRGPRGALIFSRKELSDKIDRAVFPGLQGGPHNHTISGIAVALKEAQSKDFRDYADRVIRNAKALAGALDNKGFEVVSGGTDKHLVLVDLRKSKASSWVVAWALEYAGIIVNRNTVPYDTASPFFPSGLRLGTPAITTRGMKEKEMEEIVGWIDEVVTYCKKWQIPDKKESRKVFIEKFYKELEKDSFLSKIRGEVRKLCREYPVEGN